MYILQASYESGYTIGILGNGNDNRKNHVKNLLIFAQSIR